MATLQDALTNVRCLESLALPDEQPTIEPEPASVVYDVSFDTNFADRTAFITGIGKYNEEATICSNLVREIPLGMSNREGEIGRRWGEREGNEEVGAGGCEESMRPASVDSDNCLHALPCCTGLWFGSSSE